VARHTAIVAEIRAMESELLRDLTPDQRGILIAALFRLAPRS
jgi:hypothetical protein